MIKKVLLLFIFITTIPCFANNKQQYSQDVGVYTFALASSLSLSKTNLLSVCFNNSYFLIVKSHCKNQVTIHSE